VVSTGYSRGSQMCSAAASSDSDGCHLPRRLPFVAADDGLAAGEAVEGFNPSSAVMKADALSRKPGIVGAVAFSRSGDPATGDFGDAKAIRKFGDVPDDLSAL
jgi:hypothetical protein